MKVIIVAVPILKGFGEGSKVQLDAAPAELKFWALNGTKYIDGQLIAKIEDVPETLETPETKSLHITGDTSLDIPPMEGEPKLPVKKAKKDVR